MKHLFSLLLVVGLCASCAQTELKLPVYTRVAAEFGANGNHGFVYVREVPIHKTKAVGKLYEPMHGYYSGTLIEQHGDWCKISLGRNVGYIETAKITTCSWYEGTGDQVVIAAREFTPVYAESYEDDDMPVDDYIGQGTIILDMMKGSEESIVSMDGITYYVLMTAHDNLFVRANDVDVVDKKDLQKYIQEHL